MRSGFEYEIWLRDLICDLELGYLHEIFIGEVFPGLRLTCINTEKFKTGCLTVTLVGGLSRETAASSALLPRVLRRGSSEHPDMERLSAALDELYGARLEPTVRKKGELHCVGFYADFPDDRYIPAHESVLERTAALLGGVMLSPAINDGLLGADYVESEKNNLIDDIRAAINDKRGYSIDRLIEEMCAGEAFGVGKLGGEAEASAITSGSLTAHYHNLLETSKVEAFYCGSAEPERVMSALRQALSQGPAMQGSAIHGLAGCAAGNAATSAAGNAATPAPKTRVILYPEQESPRRFTETLDVTQGKLTVGFRLGKAMERPDYPALMVLNSVYGGSVTSKLFLNVRERLSLCYYASSMIEKHKGLMIVSSGVEFSNFDTALDEIFAQLGHVKSGNISDWEFTSAKRYVITSIKAAMDSPGGLEELYFDSAVAPVPYDPAGLCGEIEAVTLDRVVEAASEIAPDSIYFLKNQEST